MKKFKRVRTSGGRLKSLQVERRNLIAQINVSTTNKERYRLNGLLKKVKSEITRLSGEPVLSEHAMLRYLERVKGVDLLALEAEILNKDMIELINTHGIGNTKIPLKCTPGCRLVVTNKTVVTVELTQ